MINLIVGRVGKIVSGDELGSYLKIIDDAENTGGFLILTASDIDFRTGHDNWVENEAALNRYFQESGWLIEWMDESPRLL